MKNIIGLGRAGVNIATTFEQYPQYTTYKISKFVEKGPRTFNLEVCKDPEEYDNYQPPLKKFFKPLAEEGLFVVCGGSIETATALRVLEQLKHIPISVLYIRPDMTYLNEMERLNERVVYHVLQEYARSGVFQRAYLVDNARLEEILKEELSIKNYYTKINELIVSTIHMINIFKHTPPAMQNISPLSPATRLSTIGVSSIEGEEKMFFPLDKIREKEYYFGISHDRLSEHGTLHQIKNYIKVNSTSEKVNYGVYSTDYENDYIYVEYHSAVIQEQS